MLTDLELLNVSEENLEWFQSNFKEIQERFTGKLIAIKDREVVASAENAEKLISVLKEKNIDDSEVLIEAVTSKDEIVIL